MGTLAGGNPIGFVEVDGHVVAEVSGGCPAPSICPQIVGGGDWSPGDVAGVACDLGGICGFVKSIVEGDAVGVALSFVPGGRIVRRVLRGGRGASRGSPWDMNPFKRGREIQRQLDGQWGRDLDRMAGVNNFKGIDQFNFRTGLATSIKSIDTSAKSYRSAGRLESRIVQDAKKLSGFSGAAAGRGTRRVEITAGMVKSRQLVVALPQGGVNSSQMKALASAAERAGKRFGVRVTYVFTP